MILQALNDLYDRLAGDESAQMPQYGYAVQRIAFALVLSRDGGLVGDVDLQSHQGRYATPIDLTVPSISKKRTSGIEPNFLWDKTEFSLGLGANRKEERTAEEHLAFKCLHKELATGTDDEGLRALLLFLDSWKPTEASARLRNWPDIIGKNIVFRLDQDESYLHSRPALVKRWAEHLSKKSSEHQARCLVTGDLSPIARLHPPIKGMLNSKQAETAIVSFNKDKKSFESFGKEQNFNAPVGERAAFGYSASLNWLLRTDNKRKIRIGDATTVFWAERKTPAEDLLAALFDPPAEQEANAKDAANHDDPAATARVREVLQAAKAGKPVGQVDPALDPDVRFYILGLSPNNARLAVRFWNVSTFGQLVRRIGHHFRDMGIERHQPGRDPEYPSLRQVILETAPPKKTSRGVERDAEKISPLLSGALTRSILTGSLYPRSFFTAILGRIRADKDVNYLRAAILKACLVRNHQMEVSMSLDIERREPAYRLGRLFALLEKAQKDATNPVATIRDRYFGAASATPAAVFPQLLRLGQHHISNPRAEYAGYTDRLIAEVVDGIDRLPKHLSLEEQGLFTIGYYHQRNALYRKGDKE